MPSSITQKRGITGISGDETLVMGKSTVRLPCRTGHELLHFPRSRGQGVVRFMEANAWNTLKFLSFIRLSTDVVSQSPSPTL